MPGDLCIKKCNSEAYNSARSNICSKPTIEDRDICFQFFCPCTLAACKGGSPVHNKAQKR